MLAPGLKDVLKHQEAEERERALRALLMRPLMPAGDPALELVRRHASYLRAGSGVRRDGTCRWSGNARGSTKGPLTRRPNERVAGVRSGSLRAPMSRLRGARARRIAACGFVFTLEHAREQRSLVAVCRLLLKLGVLTRIAGAEEGYVNQSGDVLYDVHRRVLARLPAGTRGASLIAMAQADLLFDGRLAALVD